MAERLVPAVAQPNNWTFDVLTMRAGYSYHGRSTVKHTPYGIFTSRDECEKARAQKIAELDNSNARQPHSITGEASKTTTMDVVTGAAVINQTDPMFTRTTTVSGEGAGLEKKIVETPVRQIEEKAGVNECRAF
jgi:hypothetical protein